MSNPFEILLATRGHNVAFAAACVVRVAHTSDDVWAACRALRAFTHTDVDVAPYLHSSAFVGWFDDDGDCYSLPPLRDMAHDFCDQHGGV